MDDRVAAARSSLRNTALVYSLFLVVAIVVAVYIVVSAVSGAAYVTLSFVVIVGLLLAYQVVQHLRDFGARLAESDGVVQRKFRRADLIIFMDSYYLTVAGTVFRLRPEDWIHIEEGERVKVVHFPHTLTVVSVHSASYPGTPPTPPTPPAQS